MITSMQLLPLIFSLVLATTGTYAGKIPEVATDLNLTTLVDYVVKANLADTLGGDGPFSVFGPTNEAFVKLPYWAQEEIQNITILTEYLTYHVLAKDVRSTDLSNDLIVPTVEGRPLRVNIYDNKVYTTQCAPIDLSLVDQVAGNGVIHVLNSVMIPPAGNAVEALSGWPLFETLVAAVVKADLVDTLSGEGPFTIFAPNDEAFAKLPAETLEKLLNNPDELKKVLLYHVVAGTACSSGLTSGSVTTVNGQDVQVDVSSGGVKVNDAMVIYADGSITNGVVHTIDAVLLPKEDKNNIPEVATKLGLTSLVDLVVKAELAGTLEGDGPFTVFGPTNKAFDNLPEWAKEKVQNVTVLAQYLTYHVLAKEVKSTDLSNELVVDTVEGSQLRINIYDEKIYTAQCAPIDLSQVDQQANNGVIHVLNSVMIPPAGNAVEALSAGSEFKTLVTAVQKAGLVETLSAEGPFTIFAPTDEAFGKLPAGALDKLLNNPEELKNVLLYHVVSGTACSAGLKSGSATTANGQDVQIDVSSGGVKVNDANVISADGSITNGVVHTIDTVLLPEDDKNNIPEVAAKLNLTTLVDLVAKANLVDTLEGDGPFTVFGPTNEAFDNLPDWAKEKVKNVTVLTQYLTYHVLAKDVKSTDLSNELVVDTVEGSKLRINIYDEKVYTAQCAPIDLSQVDQQADNGLIHVLNSVMIPPAGNAVETLSACPKFSTLVLAVGKAGLVDTLSGEGPFTIFAPTDEAFAKVPPKTLERLLNNPEELKEVLLYHVVSGTACSAGLKSGSVPTVNGEDVDIDVSKDGVKVNNAKVVSPDGSITNGVVHAIDTVLLPQKFLNIPEVAAKLNLTTLVDLVVKANLADTLEGEGPFTVFGPTNEAFDNLPDWAKKDVENITILTEYLTYHVLAQEVKSTDLQDNLVVATVAQKPLRINIYDEKIYTAQCALIDLSKVDQVADNGVIHVLNSVMIPPAGTAVEALSGLSNFTTLVTAVIKAGLVDTLSGKGPYTVFAPNNEAFGKIPPETLDKLLDNPDELKEVLLYHVVPGTACSASLKSGSVATVNGKSVQIRVSEDGVQVNDAKVTYADGSITNGVYHVIDTVLMPSSAISQSISLALLISLLCLSLLQCFSS